MRTTTCLLGLFLLVHAPATGAAAEPGYSRPELLLEPAALAKDVAGQKFVVLDARGRDDYDKGHVPNSHWIDAKVWAKEFGAGENRGAWATRIGTLGVGPESTIVIYDDNSSKDAARMWWILRYWGVRDVRLLNGGWHGWKQGGFAVTIKVPDALAAASFPVKPQQARLTTKAVILQSLAKRALQIVDTRSFGEYCGDEKLSNKRGGAIPGAKHLEWSDLIDKESQRFKPAGQLQQLFHDAQLDLKKPLATHCQSGGRASVMAFGLELMGADAVSNYYAGWGEWGNADDTPVEKVKK